MNFYAKNFVFDGVPSQRYGLILCNIDKSNASESGGGSIKLHTDKTLKMSNNYLLGVEQDEVLTFKVVMASLAPLNRIDVGTIQTWLFANSTYKKLQIIQPDMSTVYYNCILNNPRVISYGSYPYAFECDVICDRPWALDYGHTYNYNIATTPYEFYHNNTSQDGQILLPKIEFTTNSDNATVTIINITNNNYTTEFTKLSNGETICIDNELKIVSSSLGEGIKRLSNFNLHWFELVPNANKIKVIGNVSNLKISYQNARRVGA